MLDGDGNAITLCGFGGCPQVWNHKGRCEVPILDSRRRAPRAPARLDDSPERSRSPPEERAEGDRSSAAARQGASEDWAPKHENENGREVALQPAPEQSTAMRPDAQPATEHAPAAVDARPDTQPAPEHAPVTLDAIPDDSQQPAPEQTPLPTPTPLGYPTPRPTSEAASGCGEETPAPTLVPSMSPPESVARREEIVTEVEVDGVLMQLYLSRQSSTGKVAVAHVAPSRRATTVPLCGERGEPARPGCRARGCGTVAEGSLSHAPARFPLSLPLLSLPLLSLPLLSLPLLPPHRLPRRGRLLSARAGARPAVQGAGHRAAGAHARPLYHPATLALGTYQLYLHRTTDSSTTGGSFLCHRCARSATSPPRSMRPSATPSGRARSGARCLRR